MLLLQFLFLTKFNDSTFDSSSSTYLSTLSNLSKGTELDLVGTASDETDMAQVHSLVVIN